MIKSLRSSAQANMHRLKPYSIWNQRIIMVFKLCRQNSSSTSKEVSMHHLNKKESLLEIKAPWQVTYWEDLANHHLNQVSLHLVIAMLKATHLKAGSMPSLVLKIPLKWIACVR